MTKIQAVEIDGQWIYMQVDEELKTEIPQVKSTNDGFEYKGERKGAGNSSLVPAEKIVKDLKGLIKTMANTTLNALNESLSANVDKVTLEFGISLGTEAGFFIASGKAEGAIKISVELSFPKSEKPSA